MTILPADCRVQLGEKLLAHVVMIAIRLFDQGLHMVLSFENGGNQFAGCLDLTLSDAVKGGFAVMRKGGECLEAKHGSGALQRVQSAEDSIDLVLVGQVMEEIEQTAFDLFEELRRFRPEDLDGVHCVHLPSTFLAILTSCSGSKGFVIQPVAPAALARLFMSASDSVVRKMIGMPVWAGD